MKKCYVIMMYSYPQIVLKEVPGEISLALSISGCPLQCKGCHSKETWNKSFGKLLTEASLQALIHENPHITCVLFYGGEWDAYSLKVLLNIVKSNNLKTALYSGEDTVPNTLLPCLNYVKLGKYIAEKGGISEKDSNQRMYRIENITEALQ